MKVLVVPTIMASYQILHTDCFDWMSKQEPCSVTAIVTDPPYGVKEYTDAEIKKQRAGKGGVWRLPPAFDGHVRAAVPRFSVKQPYTVGIFQAFDMSGE